MKSVTDRGRTAEKGKVERLEESGYAPVTGICDCMAGTGEGPKTYRLN